MKKLKPVIYYDDEGTLFIRVQYKEYFESKAVPRFELPQEFYDWVAVEAPKLVESLWKRKRAKDRKLRLRMNNDKAQKHGRDVERNHLRAIK